MHERGRVAVLARLLLKLGMDTCVRSASLTPLPAAAAAAGGVWHAELSLAYERRGVRTVLAQRSHRGPLRVQKSLYPEGDSVCHTILVHPPAGIAGGDHLRVDVRVGEGAHVLLTTPGAGKWYRSAGAQGVLEQRIVVAQGAVCEWLPQEGIVHEGARATMLTEVQLAAGAGFVGSEMLCFGRTASGERFRSGAMRLHTRIERDGRPLWLERGLVQGGSPLLDAAVGLHGQPVSGTLVLASPQCDEALRDAWRACVPQVGMGAVSLLPGVLLARWLGPACEPGQGWFRQLWGVARPVVAGRAARLPRIWNT